MATAKALLSMRSRLISAWANIEISICFLVAQGMVVEVSILTELGQMSVANSSYMISPFKFVLVFIAITLQKQTPHPPNRHIYTLPSSSMNHPLLLTTTQTRPTSAPDPPISPVPPHPRTAPTQPSSPSRPIASSTSVPPPCSASPPAPN